MRSRSPEIPDAEIAPVKAKAWCVYVVRCRDGTLYTGITNDLARRLVAHDSGKGARYTRARGPVTLLHREPARDRGAALRREAAIKKLTRAEKLVLGKGPRTPSAARGARRTGER